MTSDLPGIENSATILSTAERVLRLEAEALNRASMRLSASFADAVKILLGCNGKVVVTGLGKSGHVGRKIAATLASTGTSSFYLHPTEALHGDCGMIQDCDVLLALAFGGETREVLEVVRFCKYTLKIKTIAITGRLDSTLASQVDCIIDGSVEKEACPFDLAPTVSSTLCLALGDALAITLMQSRGFTPRDFAKLHPAGTLGMRLAHVATLMRPLDQIASIQTNSSFHDVLFAVTRNNFGIAAVTDSEGNLIGAVTDGDLRRALLANSQATLSYQAWQLMSANPKTVIQSDLAVDSVPLMERYKCTSLFVVDDSKSRKLVGLLRMHDLLDAKIV